MAITFTREGSGVILNKNGVVFGLDSNIHILPHPELDDYIVITDELRFDPHDRDFIDIKWQDVTTPSVANRNDLITQLRRDFFFKLSGGGTPLIGEKITGFVDFRADLPITVGTPVVGERYFVTNKTRNLIGYPTYTDGEYIRIANNGNLNDWKDIDNLDPNDIKLLYDNASGTLLQTHIASINHHTDVNLTGLQANKSLAKWNGTEWVEYRPYFNFVEAGLTRAGQTTVGLINQSTSFERYLTLSITPRETDNYKISGIYYTSINSTGNDFIDNIQLLDGATVVKQIPSTQKERQDSGGTGIPLNSISSGVIGANINTGTNQIYERVFNEYVQLTAGTTYTLIIDWAAGGSNLEAAIHNANIACEQKTINS